MAAEWTNTIPLAPYAPDQSALAKNVTANATNVVPKGDGWGPFKSLTEFTRALPAACRGYFFARLSDGSIAVFAGTVNRLYRLNNTTFQWDDVSQGGSAYGDLVSTDNWQFAQFADLVIAVQVNTAPQKFDLSAGVAFADLGGSPPSAGSVAVINQILVLSNLLSNPRRVQWSDLEAPETWTPGTGTADFEDLVDGGVVIAIAGGDAFGRVFQDDLVRSLIYAPGSAYTFEFRKVQLQETLFAKYSIIAAGSRTFYCSASGFKMIDGAQAEAKPIGKEVVDRTFFADVDRGNLQLVIGGTDPTQTRVYWGYKSGQGNEGLIDKVLLYDWGLDRWGILIDQQLEYLTGLAKPGLTLEALDAIALTPLNVLGAADNGSGLIRLTLDAVSNSDFAIAGQNFIVVQGIDPAYMNGTWQVTIIDPTHIDLIGSTFAAAYVSGGQIGGSLDALPFSLDSISKAAVAALSAFSADHKVGFFDGDNLEAVMETAEQDLKGWMAWVSGLRPITDSPDVMCSVGCRLSAKGTVGYTDESATDDYGFAGALVETRYARGRMRVPAASVWSYAQGMQALADRAGDT